MDSIDLILRFAGITMLAFIAILWLWNAHRTVTGLLVALFCFSIASYLLCPPMVRHWQLGVIELPFFAGCFSAALFFYLMSRAIFDDQFQLRPWHLALFCLMVGLGAVHRYGAGLPPESGFQTYAIMALVLHQIVSLGITVAALILARMEKAVDLVEARRRFRDLFVGVSGLYILVVLIIEIFLRNTAANPVLERVNIAVILLTTFAFAIAMAQLKPSFQPRRSGTKPAELAPPEDAGKAKLQSLLQEKMQSEFIYRREGLTIAQLADELGTQEYLLRRLINGTMGYRNFNEFLNSYRIEEVKNKLSDPKLAKTPILTIALDSGFASLAPFNRAFKEIASVTPKEFRAKNDAGE